MSVHDWRKKVSVSNDMIAYDNLTQYAFDKKDPEALYAVFMSAYQYGNIMDGKKAMEYILAHIKEPPFEKYYVTIMKNAGFYMVNLPMEIIHNLKPRNFTLDPFNPFLIRDKNEDYISGVRLQRPNRSSVYDIFIYRKDGYLKRVFPLKYRFNYKKFKRFGAFEGIEDIRVIHVNDGTDRFLGVGTTMDTHPEGIIRMSMFYLVPTRNDLNEIIDLEASDLVPLSGYKDDSRQKNWVPFYSGNQLLFAYQYDPLILLSLDNDEGKVIEYYKGKSFLPAKQRGGTPPVKYKNDRWLFLTHCTETKYRVYYHRFIEVDLEFNITRISSLFYFEQLDCVEFGVSMIEDGNDFFISYGIKDKIAHIGRVKRETIESFLEMGKIGLF